MTNRIGICTRYDRDETSFVATILADWLDARGVDVSLFPVIVDKPAKQGTTWDRYLAVAGVVPFTEWAEQLDTVVWTLPPTYEQQKWLQAEGIRSIVLFDKDLASSKTNRKVYQRADMLLATNTAEAAACCHTAPTVPAAYLPLVPNSPTYKKAKVAAKPVVLLPIFDDDVRRQGKQLFTFLSKGMEIYHDKIELRVILSGSRNLLPPAHRRILSRWRQRYRSVSLTTCRDIRWRELQYQKADVMLWPSLVEKAMLRGLQAYCCGVPVVTYAVEPVLELAKINPQLVSPADGGSHMSEEACGRLFGTLLRAASNPAELLDCSDRVADFMKVRASLFNIAMSAVFNQEA